MNEKLLTTRQLADYLQVSVDHIHRLCKESTFRQSLHYIDVRRNGSKRANYRFKVDACVALLATEREAIN